MKKMKYLEDGRENRTPPKRKMDQQDYRMDPGLDNKIETIRSVGRPRK